MPSDIRSTPDRVAFGPGSEASAADLLAEAGAARVLLIATAAHRAGADRLARALGDRCVGVFAEALPQVPRAVADAAARMAADTDADWVVAHGGGTAIGVAKAVALQRDVSVGAIPTTYAGSERTDIWGITEAGTKRTGRDERVRPRLVVYDPDLQLGLSREVSLLSLLNALAHSVEALYADSATPDATQAAIDSLEPLLTGLTGIGADPTDPTARAVALRGAWKASEALGGASMALHHKLAHVLGGSFGTPHAATHATLLPHTLGFNLPSAPAARAALCDAWGTDDPAGHLADRMRDLGLSVRLRDLGLSTEDLPRIARQAVAHSYPNPRPFDAETLLAMLHGAWLGRRPTAAHRRLDLDLAGTHGGVPATLAGAPLDRAPAVVIALHGRGSEPDRFVHDLRQRAGSLADSVAWIAPAAHANTWYPKGFRADWADNAPDIDHAIDACRAAWRAARAHVPAHRIVVVGFSQGACLLLTWLRRDDARPGAVLAFSGAHTPTAGDYTSLRDTAVHMGVSADDPYIPAKSWGATVAALRAGGATVSAHAAPHLPHALHPFDDAALRCALELLVSDRPPTQTGFGNHLRSEAVAGALPLHQNSPQQAPYGLIAEQLNGTGFTVERSRNRRTWLYRLRPAIHHRPFEPLATPPPHFVTDFSDAVPTPQVRRHPPQSAPPDDQPTDLLDGLQTYAGAGDPSVKRGMAIHLYAANRDMQRAFANIDGDLLFAPRDGRLRVQTELGWLTAGPGDLLLLPRGLRFRVELPDGGATGFAAELYEGHFELPQRGPLGANGLADERHFHAPVAAYEDDPTDTPIVVKQGGRFWATTAPHSPFDVVAWHGTYAPFVYRLDDFQSMGSVAFDHPDPSVLTVLTCPMDTHGRNAIDVAVFRGRWDPTEHTFRPPYFHRNSAIEFNMVLGSSAETGPFRPGAFIYTPYLTPHGVSARGQGVELDRDDDHPHRIPDDSLWLQFESTYLLKVLPRWLTAEAQDPETLRGFEGYRISSLARAPAAPETAS